MIKAHLISYVQSFLRYTSTLFTLNVWVVTYFLISTTAEAVERLPTTDVNNDHKNVRRPNILLIVADDLGYTDLGAYGGEIDTPNIDALADEGVVFSDFYAAPACSPTRSMLMSGMDSHLAGLGNMAEEVEFVENQKGKPGYEGHLSFKVISLPEAFKAAGYHTYMTGKWHLGTTKKTRPAARGFEKSFVLVKSGGAHLSMIPSVGPGKAEYRENDKRVDSLPKDFYSTEFFTEKLIEYIDEGRIDNRPFFGYLAYTAPHWPLQAPKESIAKYKGKYSDGYGRLLENRLKGLQTQNLIGENIEAFPKLPGEAAWEDLTLEQRQVSARKMEIYAAMVDDLDKYVGRVVDYLKNIGEYENTFIFLMSDNGPEGHHLDRGWDSLARWVKECCDNSYENMGRGNSYLWYGPNWARAGTAPSRLFKGFTSEGGIKVPAIAHYSKFTAKGLINRQLVSVMDVMPTLLELARIQLPKDMHYKERKHLPMQGKSMLEMLMGESDRTHGPEYVLGWELFGKRAIRHGEWKLLWEPSHKLWSWHSSVKTDRWQLYHLPDDPAELYDVSGRYPDKYKQMIALWDKYVAENNVILPNFSSGY